MNEQILVGIVHCDGFSLLECTHCGPLTTILDQYVPDFIVDHLRDVHGETGWLQVMR